MKLNPGQVGSAFVAFFIGAAAIYILYGIGEGGIVNICLDVAGDIGLIPANEWQVVAPIIWWGTLLFSIMAVIIYPTWVYFEEDSKE